LGFLRREELMRGNSVRLCDWSRSETGRGRMRPGGRLGARDLVGGRPLSWIFERYFRELMEILTKGYALDWRDLRAAGSRFLLGRLSFCARLITVGRSWASRFVQMWRWQGVSMPDLCHCGLQQKSAFGLEYFSSKILWAFRGVLARTWFCELLPDSRGGRVPA